MPGFLLESVSARFAEALVATWVEDGILGLIHANDAFISLHLAVVDLQYFNCEVFILESWLHLGIFTFFLILIILLSIHAVGSSCDAFHRLLGSWLLSLNRSSPSCLIGGSPRIIFSIELQKQHQRVDAQHEETKEWQRSCDKNADVGIYFPIFVWISVLFVRIGFLLKHTANYDVDVKATNNRNAIACVCQETPIG